MIVMPGNDGGAWWGYLAGRFAGRIGSLLSPGRWRRPVPFAPYALDNGAFTGFKEDAFLRLLDKAAKHIPPMWVVVPDAIQDRDGTLRLWKEWRPRLDGWRLAMAVQDGMSAADVPNDVDVVFVGGTTKWKWQTMRGWCSDFPRVHVGRVNTERHLWMAHECGAESCDGSGWMRDVEDEVPALVSYLEQSTNGRNQLFLKGVLE